MAEAILYNVAERITETLESQAFKENGLLWGVTDELEKLKKTVLTEDLDFDKRCTEKREVSNVRLEKLKDAVDDVDKLLDGFCTECLLREMMITQNKIIIQNKMAKKVRIFFSKSNPLVYHLKMGQKIKAIRQELEHAISDYRNHHLDERPVETLVAARKGNATHSYVDPAEVIGREDDKKVIIKRLLSDSNIKENVGILPITGIGGLGKTTLARFIFNDEQIDKHFQLKMWAYVSESFEVENVVGKILESATKKRPENAGMRTLVHNLRKEIGGKKYFLVLDDVWNDDVKKWDKVKKVLLEIGARGSRILVTTRSAKVAIVTQTIEPYSLQVLNSQKSWSLFEQVAFKNRTEPGYSRKVEVGRKIVEKCSGVPFLIKKCGGLLSIEDDERGWDHFEKNKMPKTKEEFISTTIKPSYDQLPSHLKQCFAYCSKFPKNCVINKSKLIFLWIAQGFIKVSNKNECLEDVGHEYFVDLLQRSFFQEVEMDDLGNVNTTKMSDLMHDLARSVQVI